MKNIVIKEDYLKTKVKKKEKISLKTGTNLTIEGDKQSENTIVEKSDKKELFEELLEDKTEDKLKNSLKTKVRTKGRKTDEEKDEFDEHSEKEVEEKTVEKEPFENKNRVESAGIGTICSESYTVQSENTIVEKSDKKELFEELFRLPRSW